MQAAFLYVWGLELFLAGGKQAAADHYSIMQAYPPARLAKSCCLSRANLVGRAKRHFA